MLVIPGCIVEYLMFVGTSVGLATSTTDTFPSDSSSTDANFKNEHKYGWNTAVADGHSLTGVWRPSGDGPYSPGEVWIVAEFPPKARIVCVVIDGDLGGHAGQSAANDDGWYGGLKLESKVGDEPDWTERTPDTSVVRRAKMGTNLAGWQSYIAGSTVAGAIAEMPNRVGTSANADQKECVGFFKSKAGQYHFLLYARLELNSPSFCALSHPMPNFVPRRAVRRLTPLRVLDTMQETFH